MYDEHQTIESCGMIVLEGSSVLLIEKNGQWDLPKGTRETGESCRETALRELYEETSISHCDVQVLTQLIDTSHFSWSEDTVYLKTTHWYLGDYRGSKQNIIYPDLDENITQVIWVPLSTIMEYVPIMRSYARYILEFTITLLQIERKKRLQS